MVFCVHILGVEQGALCRSFAVSGADNVAGIVHAPAPVTGLPGWMPCPPGSTAESTPSTPPEPPDRGGVEATGAAGQGDPLFFHKGRFGRFSD